MTITLPNGSDTTTQILGAISVKGRAPLRLVVDGFLRRRHHHPAGTRCVELRTPDPETESTEPPATPDWLPAPIQDPALGDDETPTDTTVAIGDLTGTEDGYIGRHRDPLQREADWTPAHTQTAARHRAQLQHVRADGVRPDLRIEQTVGLSIERINEMLAGGAA